MSDQWGGAGENTKRRFYTGIKGGRGAYINLWKLIGQHQFILARL